MPGTCANCGTPYEETPADNKCTNCGNDLGGGAGEGGGDAGAGSEGGGMESGDVGGDDTTPAGGA